MSTPEISRVLAEMRALAVRSQGSVRELPEGAGGFGDLLKQSVDAVDRQHDFNPAFSPDGTRILFTSTRKGPRDI